MVQPLEYRQRAEDSEFSRIVQAIRRRFWIILGFVALTTAIAVYVGAQQTSNYTASVQIVLEPADNTNPSDELVAGSLSKDASAIETQIKLLRTHSHIKDVITALDLETRWADRVQGEGDGDRTADGSSWGTAFAGRSEDTANDARMDALHSLFNENYRVQQEGQSYVISIYYTSEDPVEAAEIANGAADVFIETKRSEKLGVTEGTSQWLSKRADTLYRELQEVEDEIARFREENPAHVQQAPGQNGEIAVLTAELAGIRGELSAKVATLTLAKKTQSGQGDLRGIAEINTSLTLKDLLGEQLALLGREVELGKTYGKRHPLMIQHEAEQQRLTIKIEQETARIVASIENDVRILEARRDSLEEEIAGLRRQEVGNAKVTFQLQDLLRRADTTRELYRSVLQRSKEIGEQQEIVKPDVRLVSRASVPRAPSSPGAKIYGAIGFCGSSLLSLMLVLLLDRMDKRLRTPGQIKEAFGIETAALVPEVGKGPAPQRRLIELPRSIYADAMRAAYMAIRNAATEEKDGQVVLTTSSLPDEGKSTLSLSLALAAAKQTKDVIIIDMDLRHPQIHKMVGQPPKKGVDEYCRNSSVDLPDCIHYEQDTGLNYLFVKDLPHDPSATINSERFPLLIERLRQDFDLIMIDAAPVLAVTETRLLLPYVDLVAFCVRWGRTDIDTVTEALNNIWSHETPPPVMAVLTRVDMEKGAAYGLSSSRHRKAFKKYYQEA